MTVFFSYWSPHLIFILFLFSSLRLPPLFLYSFIQIMKKFRNNTNTAENAGNSELEVPLKSPDSITTEVERAVNQSAASSPSSSSIKLTSKGAIQLTSSSNPKATTNAILNLKNNPFFHDKRKWDESFTVDEKKELTGNIVKAASMSRVPLRGGVFIFILFTHAYTYYRG